MNLTDTPELAPLKRLDRSRLVAAGLALAVGALVITGAYGFILHTQVTALQASVAEKTALIDAGKTKLDAALTSASDLEKKVVANLALCRTSHLKLEAAIDAFATQAASCETVKRQLNIGAKS